MRLQLHRVKIGFVLFLVLFASYSRAQLTVTTGASASALAGILAGAGVTTFGATLTCPSLAEGTFTATGTLVSMSSGIVLTNGHASACSGAEPPLTSFNDGAPGDPSFVTLGILPAGTNTYDACELEFNLVPKGDTVSFNYQLGSDEYRSAVCSPYNDAFAFFISGPGITGTPNIALVPGTNLPVEINTVNNGIPGSSGGVLSNCTSIGAGSPFTAYYLDNTGGTLLSYRGYTMKFRAFHAVTACDTYHLKLAIVDAGNGIYDSGVFLEAGSLHSGNIQFDHLTTVGTTIAGIPNALVKGCGSVNINVLTTPASTSPITVSLAYGGTASLGSDFTSPGSVVIAAGDTTGSFTLTGLPTPVAGTRSVTIYLSGGCALSDSVTINLLDTPSALILTPDTTICAGSVILRTNGSTGLTYAWTPPASLSSTTAAQPTATPTATTTYTMTATLPGSGCPPIVRDVSVSVINTAVSISTPSGSICSGSSVNISTAAASGLDYNWMPAASLNNSTIANPVASPTATTTYSVTTTAPGGLCPSTAQITITVNTPTATILTPDTTVCQNPFVIRVSGTPGLIYSWSPPAGLNSTTLMQPTANPTVTTTYTMTATLPGSGCPPIAQSITVTVDNVLISLLTPDTTVCVGDTVFFRLDGSPDYTYTWTPASSLSAVHVPQPAAFPTITTTYFVTASGPSGSCPARDTITVTVINPAAHILTPDTTICLFTPFRILVDTSVASSYLWTPSSGLSSATVPDPLVTTDSMHTYVLTTITQTGGCIASDSVTIGVAGSGSINFKSTDSVFCAGVGASMVAMGDIGSSGVVWSFGNGDTMVANPVFYAYSEPGTYTVSVTSLYLGCPDTVKQKVIHIYSVPRLDLGNDTSICPGGERILLWDKINAANPGATWLWSTGATAPAIFVGAPGTYFVTVSFGGCETTDSVIVSNDCYLDVPNVFTPNGDGINDYFLPRQLLSKGLTYFRMSIYNRWGEVIFQTNTLDGRGWDGCFNGIPQPEGVFVYLIDAGFKDAEVVHRQGTITLLR